MDARLQWRWGYVESVELARVDDLSALELLLAHPSMRFIEELIILNGHTEQLVAMLPLARLPPTLKVVGLPRATALQRRTLTEALPSVARVESSRPHEPRTPDGFFTAD